MVLSKLYASMALDCDNFKRALKRILNWKSAGPDFHSWILGKKFSALHGAFLCYLMKCCQDHLQ